jgi:hypothetical protein
MPSLRPSRFHLARRLPYGLLLAAVVVVFLWSCKPAQKADTEQADQMAMWLDSVPQLKSLNISNAEVTELNKAHQAGLTDPSTVVLIQLARDRKIPFADGDSVADLLNAGSSEATVLELARLNQLGPWAGEARAMRLAGLSDKIILAVAHRRSKGLTVLSGEKLGELKNTGVTDAMMMEMIEKGDSDAMATKFVAERERAAGGHRFVYQTHAHK